jgi:hypothetical protein
MPLKPLRKDEELSAIPLDEPVLVELEPAATNAEVDEPLKVEPKKGEKEPTVEDGADALRTEMEAMRKANATREAKLARERDEALRSADDARRSAADTEADLIANGLQGAQAEVKAARAALKVAVETGDADAMADANERISRAATDVRDFERAAAQQAAEAERRKNTPEPEQRRMSVEESIDARTDLTDGERKWLKEHQDAWVDPARNQELGVAYQRAVKAKLVRGTPAYFEFIEEFMGYREPERREDDNTERSPTVSAPVSRDSRSPSTGRVQTSRVELSPEERQMARDMGITDTAYAKGKLQLAAAKQADPEKYARTR